MIDQQLSLVSQGGGIGGGAYVVGVMKALKEYELLPCLTKTYTSSSATPAVVYPLLGKDRLLEYVWTEEVTKPEVIDLRRAVSRNSALNIDHLVDNILTKHPFDERTFHEHPTTMYISVTQVGDVLKHHFFTNRDPYDHLTMIKASIAIPLLYGKSVNVGDVDYIDGGVTSQLPFFAVPCYEPMIAIVTNHKNKLLTPGFGERQLLRIDKIRKKTPFSILAAVQGRHQLYAHEYHELQDRYWHKQSVVVIQPEESLPASITCNKPKLVEATIKRGYDDAMTKMRDVEGLLMKKVS